MSAVLYKKSTKTLFGFIFIGCIVLLASSCTVKFHINFRLTAPRRLPRRHVVCNASAITSREPLGLVMKNAQSPQRPNQRQRCPNPSSACRRVVSCRTCLVFVLSHAEPVLSSCCLMQNLSCRRVVSCRTCLVVVLSHAEPVLSSCCLMQNLSCRRVVSCRTCLD